MTTIMCATCGNAASRPTGEVNRATRLGKRLFCSRGCFHVSRRVERSDDEKKAMERAITLRWRLQHPEYSREYNKSYYARNRKKSIASYQEYYAANRDSVIAKQRVRGAKRQYGEFADAYLLLLDLRKEIRRLLPDHYERYKARGCYDRQNAKRRERRRINANGFNG